MESTGWHRGAAQQHATRIVAVIPAYNAEMKLGGVIHGLRDRVDCVVVVNDGSTDATATVAAAAGAVVVEHALNRGLGCALRTGFDAALAHGADIVVTLDADGQHSPEDIGRVVSRLIANHCEVVIGSRLTNTSQWPKFPPLRLLGNLVLTVLTNAAAGAHLTTDSQSGYRAFTREALSQLDLHATHMAISSEIVLECARTHSRIAEVPIEATYEDEISAQRLLADPVSIIALVLKRWSRRLRGSSAQGVLPRIAACGSIAEEPQRHTAG